MKYTPFTHKQHHVTAMTRHKGKFGFLKKAFLNDKAVMSKITREIWVAWGPVADFGDYQKIAY